VHALLDPGRGPGAGSRPARGGQDRSPYGRPRRARRSARPRIGRRTRRRPGPRGAPPL